LKDIKEIKIDRFRFLRKVYDETAGGQRSHHANMWSVGNDLGFEKEYTRDVTQFLVDEMLIEYYTAGGNIRMTHFGRKEIEEALEKPDEPTEHFLPVNVVINFGTLQTQSVRGTQNVATQESIPASNKPAAFWKKHGLKIVIGVITMLIGSFFIYLFGWNR
jgi:hypothetical protein